MHSDDQLMLDCGAGNSNVTQLGLHADYGGRNTVERNSRPFVANCPPTLALPLRSASKIYELQLMDPTFVSEWRKPKAVFFQGIGGGDGNRTHDIQLGKVFELSPLALFGFSAAQQTWPPDYRDGSDSVLQALITLTVKSGTPRNQTASGLLVRLGPSRARSG